MQNKKVLMWVGGALAVVVIALVIYAVASHKTQQPAPVSQAPIKTEAPAGQVVKGFPQQIIPSTQKPIDSYSIDYSGQEQYTTTTTSDQPIATVAKGYVDYFNKNGFTSVKQTNNSPTLISIFAVLGNAHYSLVLQQPDPKGNTQVDISVLKH